MIAAVNGAAVGWGMELALMADLRVASERAKLRRAVRAARAAAATSPGSRASPRWSAASSAAELLFTGDVIDAEEALRIGLVSRVVPHAELLPSGARAREQDRREPAARRAARSRPGLRDALDPDWHELGAWVRRSLGELFQTEDHREGVARSSRSARRATQVADNARLRATPQAGSPGRAVSRRRTKELPWAF